MAKTTVTATKRVYYGEGTLLKFKIVGPNGKVGILTIEPNAQNALQWRPKHKHASTVIDKTLLNLIQWMEQTG